MSLARYYMGVDGGGTRSRVRLFTAAGEMIGEGLAGPGNIRLGLPSAWANVMKAAHQALDEAGLARSDLSEINAGLGLAGVVTDADAANVIDQAPAFREVHVSSDAHAACLGAFGGGDGAILIAGTGSAAYLLAHGVAVPLSGWGFVAGDRGSAAVLGREAVANALDVLDGLAPPSRLSEAIIEHLGSDRAAIVDWIQRATPRDFGALAPLVIARATCGDDAAVVLVRASAAAIEAMIRRLVDLGAPSVSLVGGMARYIRPWLSPWVEPNLAAPQHDAVTGASILAGLRITQGNRECLRA